MVHFNNAGMPRIPALLFWAAILISSGAEARLEFDSSAGFEYDLMPGAIGNGRQSEGWVSTRLGMKWQSESNERFRFEGVLSGDFLLLSPSTENSRSQTLAAPGALEWNRSGSPHFLEDQEFFLEYRYGHSRTSVGSRTLRWGIADFFDPLDQINSRRMEKPIQSMKRGEWMLFSEVRGSSRYSVSFEAFVIPIKRGAILPSQTSAWLPRQLYVPNLPDTEFQLPTSLDYKYRDREELEQALRWNAGARILWRPGESEIALQYDEGASSFPSIRPSVSGPLIGIRPDGRKVIQADPLIELTEVYYRERHYGASITRPLGSSLARAQIGKTEPLYGGRTLAHDRSDATIAIERQFGLGSFGNLTVLAQGFKNLLEDESGGTDLASFSKLFDRAAAIGFRLAPSETTSLMLGGLRSFTTKGGLLIMSSYAFDISSNVTVELAWTWFDADLDSPLGPYKDNDGGSLKLTGSF